MPDRGATSRGRPASTYRLQLHEGFDFADAAAIAGYLSALGAGHAYLSPILQAAPGSAHGYDVVDHSLISAELGGEDGFRAMAARFAERGIGIVVDVVSNHMAIPAPEYLNRQLWSVLRDGRESAQAHWFDIDWDVHDGRMLLPVLAAPLHSCLDELTVGQLGSDGQPVLHYSDHVLPLRPGTDHLPMAELVQAQCYLLADWRSAAAELNWRRFLDISSLIAIRVDEPDVFAASHGLLLGLVAEGLINGLRIDHPDGLADPGHYLRQLATATGRCWTVAEKVLSAGEVLPADWQCAGTTGYDALAAVGELFTDPAGAQRLGAEYIRFGGGPGDFAEQAWAARREIASQQLAAEVARLGRVLGRLGEPLLDMLSPPDRRAILAELLAAVGVYRAYVTPGKPPSADSVAQLTAAAAQARARIAGSLQPAADLVVGLLLGRDVAAGDRPAGHELIVRFQQSCAAVQAKGVEDTAGYRWTRLVSANEVGSDPDHPGRGMAAFHRFARRLACDWPATMTTLSTHDTKRQEDVRARLAVLAESPETWGNEVAAWHERALRQLAGHEPAVVVDPPTEYLLWQTIVGAWPINADRLAAYLRKAMREAKLRTSWTEPDSRYEAAAITFAQLALADDEIANRIAAFVGWLSPDARANCLGAKLVQLTMPGVPDVYQGCELTGLSLVDPDNRRPVDFGHRMELLTTLDEAGLPQAGKAAGNLLADLDAAKLLVTNRALRLRRAHPDWFAGDYQQLRASGPTAAHAVAFCRAGQTVTVATRLPGGLRRSGGWQDAVLTVPSGCWQDLLTGAEFQAARARRRIRLAEVTAKLPVALLVRADGDETGAA
ncbi:MAG: malto-oligosyltrehalose synthase [Streptosporangiaceae bacterium]